MDPLATVCSLELMHGLRCLPVFCVVVLQSMIIDLCGFIPILKVSVHVPILWWILSGRGYNQLEIDDGDSMSLFTTMENNHTINVWKHGLG